ncbi:LLM class flavin-dependent oxidoreductase [Agrococcus sp. SGAir0287]|uniref:LLM class flavin-dependent oxidoreductase n=1 Tax=Agrococcus sp. SGAir0287 TaxID=2070347 RepID=UPI0010CCF39F|nr:LLM class flavin-dependent oxidoreductase [Agrococcus sp. SGAir0287]QCR20206.1 N5,N10-methylene tetrahydromethanopterin reductase [Agrococcus sp. SGAir0287]
MVDVALILPPDQPPESFCRVAVAADAAGLDELWVWEDCFAQSGVAAAAAILAWTPRIRVGIGLMPAPLRAVALEAMEVATLARLFPGRLLPGFGHGVQSWMAQAGVRARSPMTLLREHLEALRPLLAGESVTTIGDEVVLDDVWLRWPPREPLPLLVGATGARSLALAGELGDGVILTDGHDVDVVAERMRHVRAARDAAGRPGAPAAVVFLGDRWGSDARSLAERIRSLAAVGATSVAVFHADEPGGAPIGDDRILESVAIVAEARTLLRG